MTKVALVGNGYLGQAYAREFPDALIYDEPKGLLAGQKTIEDARKAINECDIALVAVPTDPMPDGSLDMSIVESVVDWLETDTVLIKSALMPGTVDSLVAKTGKNIAVSVEYIGMGNYFLPPNLYPHPTDPQQHKLLVIGGTEPARTQAAELLWSKMSPDVRIHLVTAKEAEITKLLENAYGALKVTWANCMYNLVNKSSENFIRVHQAWSEDGRVDPMHTRVVAGKRGWKSHCYDKDIQALAAFSRQAGANDMDLLIKTVVQLNEEHLNEN